MAINENPVFGRKIFFLNPPYAIKTTVVEKLRAQEYEAFNIENYRIAKDLLRMNQDAICFIDIDSELSPKEWFNFVKSFEEDEVLSTIFIGILSQKVKLSDKNQFLLKASIPGGFIMLTEGLERITDKITRICEINGSKGRRQYVRLDCRTEEEATVHASKDGRLYTMKLIDISSVGFACAIPNKDADKFVEKEVVSSIIITLGKRTINCEAAIFAIKPGENFSTLVMLLLPSTATTTKNMIRNFVFTTMQKNIDLKASVIIEDKTDYSIEPKNIENDNSSKFINDEAITDIMNADDISELEDIDEVFV